MLKKINIWYLSSLFITLIVAVPISTIILNSFSSSSGYLELLKNTFLLDYLTNSLILLLGVLGLTFLFGVLSAYFIAFYKFPGSSFFNWALILSFAVPPYIYAYSLTAFFENYGTAFSILTNLFGDYEYNKYIPKFDGFIGSIFSMSFSIFGYVYVLTRAAFYYQSHNLIEVSQNLGLNSRQSFFKIILPSARPAIVVGLSLVAMETLSDFGTVSFFSISTLTTGIYNAWIAYDDLKTANLLSLILLIFILLFFFVENFSRKGAKYHQSVQGHKSITKILISGKNSILAVTFCSLLFFCSFIFPTLQMLYWTLKYPKYFYDLDIFSLNINTLFVVLFSSFFIIFFSFITNYGNRVTKSKLLKYLNIFSISGYAIPGVILAVALISFFAWISNALTYVFGIGSLKSVFIGSIFGLVLAYFVRFYSLAFNGIKSAYSKINKSIDESSYLLGLSKFKTFSTVHLPYLRNSIFLISVLLTIELIRELPLTLILRPYNFETFATKAYHYASQDLLEAAALPSLLLIFWASFFIIITSKYILSDK